MARSNSGETPLSGPISPYQGQGQVMGVGGGTLATTSSGVTPYKLNPVRPSRVFFTPSDAAGHGDVYRRPGRGPHWRARLGCYAGRQAHLSGIDSNSAYWQRCRRPPAEDADTFRRTQIFLLKNHDLMVRVLAEPAVASLEMVRNADDPIKLLEDGVVVSSSSSPNILVVSLTGDNPDDLTTILDMLVKKYLDDTSLEDRRQRERRITRLDATIDKIISEITSKEKAMRLRAETNSVTDAVSTGAMLAVKSQNLGRVEAEIYSLRNEINDLESDIALFKKKLESKNFSVDPALLARLVEQDPRVAELTRARNIQAATMKRDQEKATDQNAPSIVDHQSKIDQLTREIIDVKKIVEPEIQKLSASDAELNLKARTAEAQEKLVQKTNTLTSRQSERDKIQDSMRKSAGASVDIDSMLKELEPMRLTLFRLQTERVNLVVDKQHDSKVSIRESPFVSKNQNIRQKILLSVAAGIICFFAAIGLIGFLEWRTRRIDGAEQVVLELGMRIIGTVPAFPSKASLKAAETAGKANWRFVLNEAINSTRTMLLHTARTQSMQVVMVTSATQGEGKTSLSSQLGSSMAAAGMRTLIVDCDLRNPSIHKLFDLSLTLGVSEVLCQEADVTEAIQPTNIPNLWIIPAGLCSNRVIAALAQGHPLETMFNRLRGQFDFIVVDSCPVLPVADALLIGQHVDGVLFSIMQDISQLPKIQVASDKLNQLNIPLVGAVVNGVSMGSAYYAYGYNYVKQLPV